VPTITVIPHPGTGLGPGEPVRDPLVYPVQLDHHQINYRRRVGRVHACAWLPAYERFRSANR
jgi:hypothetical protein